MLRASSCLFLIALMTSCGDGRASARAPAEPRAAAEPHEHARDIASARAPGQRPDAAPVVPALDPSPAIDLLHNRFLWHLHDEGLLVPVASEGLRKYSHEYRNPWGEAIEAEGQPGRVLSASRAVLNVPMDAGGPVSFRLRVMGAARGQSVAITLNGARAAEVSLEPGWQSVTAASRAPLTPGENQIELRVKARGRAGGQRTHALWHSIEIIPAADAAPRDHVPALSPAGTIRAGDQDRPALTGFSRLSMLVEVPEAAWLRVDTTSAAPSARFLIRATRAAARDQDAAPLSLLDHEQTPGVWTRHHLSLAPLAGELVRLELESASPDAGDESGASWGEPRILLEAAPSAPVQPVDSVILFVVDTLRADRLSLYGETRVETPHMTAAAQQGSAVFLHSQAASPSSPPSHTSIQTGTMPRVHGVAGDQGQIRDDTPILSALAGAAGLNTGYVGNNNFAMGRFKAPGRWSWFYEPVFNRQGVDCAPLIQAMLRFVDERGGERFFLSALPLEPHTPYRYHEGITDRYFDGPYDRAIGKSPGTAIISRISAGRLPMNEHRWAQIRALYDGEVTYADECFGTLWRGLDERGKLDSTAVVITSDHGEGLGERGRVGHAYGHHAELSNVPFVIVWPRGHALAGGVRVLDTVTSHIDIAPTVLDLLGLPADSRMQGQSMLEAIRRQGPSVPRVVASEYGRSYALRAQKWKYIVDYGGRESLHDLARDAGELRDVKAEHAMAHRYMRDVAGFYLAHRARWHAATWGDLNNHGPGLADHVGR